MNQEIVRLSDYNPTTPIQIHVGGQTIELSVESALKCCVPAGAQAVDVLQFLLFCRANCLDPLMGDACMVPRDGRHIPVVLKAGWMRKLMDDPRYEGHEAGVMTLLPDGTVCEVKGTVYPPDQLLLGGWVRIFIKGRRPFFHSVDFTEYNSGKSTWKAIPRTMIRKVAFVQAVRECILLYHGGYDQSEVPPDIEVSVAPPAAGGPALEAAYETVVDPNLSPDLLAALHREFARIEATQEEVAGMCRNRGVAHLAELSDMQGADLLRKLQEVPMDDEPFAPAGGPGGDGQPVVADATQDEGEPTDDPSLLGGVPPARLDRPALEMAIRRKAYDLGTTDENWLRLLRQIEGVDHDDPQLHQLRIDQLIAFECFFDDQKKRRDQDPANYLGVPDSLSGFYLLPPVVRREPEPPKKRGRKKTPAGGQEQMAGATA